MKTQYPCNNTKNQIHIYLKHNVYHIVLPGTAMESPANADIEGMGSDTLKGAMDLAIKAAENIVGQTAILFFGAV